MLVWREAGRTAQRQRKPPIAASGRSQHRPGRAGRWGDLGYNRYVQEKQCARCERTRPLDEFKWLYRHNRGKHERFRDAWCANCRREYKRLPAQRAKAAERAWLNVRIRPELREKSRLNSKSYYENNRAKVLEKARIKGQAGGWLDTRLRQKFGIGLLEYQQMVEAQENKCKLCGREERTRQRRLAVDHCHATMKIRGLLCHHCNTGLGNFMDDIDLLRRAIAYLEGP